jgi:hypothetical protein
MLLVALLLRWTTLKGKNVASATSTRLVTSEPAWLTSELGIPISLGTLRELPLSEEKNAQDMVGWVWGLP